MTTLANDGGCLQEAEQRDLSSRHVRDDTERIVDALISTPRC